MTLPVGTRIGSYEITGVIGAGGMGQVYRAHDTKLNRDVALKMLPAGFAKDQDGAARLQREAHLLASLNHPNIASIYGLEESNGDLALALEFIDGEDLAERLQRGPVPVDESIGIAKQIAEGLEAAHEKGVIHRDLKPANIKITKNGVVKILDFGLAKTHEGETGSFQSGVSQSPTMARFMTQQGMILGTVAYMSPEQARGREVDKRADIWAFGVVLYEMLTGKRPFDGDTVSDSIAAVLTRDLDWSALPASVPPSVQRLLKHCLNRDPKKRLRDMGDALADLEETSVPESTAGATQQRGARSSMLPWIVAMFAIAVAIATWAWMMHRPNSANASAGDVMHLDITYPPEVEPFSGLAVGFSVSPDGKSFAMIGIKDGMRRLYVRQLDRSEATEIRDVAGVNSAFFSPDGASLVYVPSSTLVTRLSLADQQRTVLASGADVGASVAWTTAGIFYNSGGALWLVAPEGGKPRQLTVLDAARHEVIHADPIVLPGGRIALFTSFTTEFGTERIEAISIENGRRWVVLERAITPVWSPTGHLLFGRDGVIFAVPFDPENGTVHGVAVPVIPAGVVGTVRTGDLGYQISPTGTLVFVPYDFGNKNVVSVGRDGSEFSMNLPPSSYFNPRISPDGRRMLIEEQASAIDIVDLARGTRARLTAAALGTSFPTWTSDGKAGVFRHFSVPFWAAADGSGKEGTVPDGVVNDFPTSPGPDPDSFVANRIQPETSSDVYLISISGKFPPKPLVKTPAYEGGPELSPDGHWLIYQSNESGQSEIYVRRYPVLDRAWQVSEGGGMQARWSTTNREIFYRNGRQMMAVTFEGSGAEPTFGKPTVLFASDYEYGQGVTIPNYDVTPDGRFIMLRRGTQGNSLKVVINWTEELKRILAAGGVH